MMLKNSMLMIRGVKFPDILACGSRINTQV